MRFTPAHPHLPHLMHVSEPHVAELANGVRVLTIRLPHLDSVSVSVFVRTGSRHESRRLNGISHVVEHMAFKGTHARSCQQINLDAERLGAEVNAHTDKDHTAFHMHGLARDSTRLLQMLADIVQNPSFPQAELERERRVILQEFLEDEDDPLSTAYKLFDRLCFGTHPAAQPVIGSRPALQRITRADLLAYVHQQYTGANLIVGVAGPVDPDAIVREAEAAFGSMPRGSANEVAAPGYIGGIGSRRQTGCNQTHVVLGFPIPALAEDHHAGLLAAGLFGEGMSSPLMDEIRERRGLVYYAACSADVMDQYGQFVIEASTTAEHVDEFFDAVTSLLLAHADSVDPVALERARNQFVVRSVRALEHPQRRLEDAALDLLALGHIRSPAARSERIAALGAADLCQAFAGMLAQRPSVAIAGNVRRGSTDRVQALLASRHLA
jgi:predicted Zn-dependent peptidase